MADTQTATELDPYASIRKRVLEQMPGGSGQYSEGGSAIPQATDLAPTQTPDFQYAATPQSTSVAAPDMQSPEGQSPEGGATGQPTQQGQPVQNPYDQNDPRNQGTGGTYNQPEVGNDANQINGWYGSYLGRDPEPGAIEGKLTEMRLYGKTLSQIQNEIANSPEAMAYAKSKGFGQQPQTTTTQTRTGTGGGPGTSAVTASATSAFTDELRKILMERLKSAAQPIDENSPQISSALQAARDESQRLSDRERTTLAERLYAQGVGGGGGGLQSNALTQQIQQSAERNAGALSTLRANLLMNAYNQKHDELMSDLQLAFASGDAESARAIQIQIANLQATVQREGLGVDLAKFKTSQNGETVNTAAGG